MPLLQRPSTGNWIMIAITAVVVGVQLLSFKPTGLSEDLRGVSLLTPSVWQRRLLLLTPAVLALRVLMHLYCLKVFGGPRSTRKKFDQQSPENDVDAELRRYPYRRERTILAVGASAIVDTALFAPLSLYLALYSSWVQSAASIVCMVLCLFRELTWTMLFVFVKDLRHQAVAPLFSVFERALAIAVLCLALGLGYESSSSSMIDVVFIGIGSYQVYCMQNNMFIVNQLKGHVEPDNQEDEKENKKLGVGSKPSEAAAQVKSATLARVRLAASSDEMVDATHEMGVLSNVVQTALGVVVGAYASSANSDTWVTAKNWVNVTAGEETVGAWMAMNTILGLLILGTVVVMAVGYKYNMQDKLREVKLRIWTWWVIVGSFAFCMWLGDSYVMGYFGFVSFLAFKEFLSLIPTRRADRRVLLWAYLSIPVQYWIVSVKWYNAFVVFIPLFMMLWIPVNMLLTGVTKGFLKSAAVLHWGLMLTTYSISHAAMALSLPASLNPLGLLVYLVMLTELNDVAQFCWGKSLGHRFPAKVAPRISPKKTWVGLLGGNLSLVVLSSMFYRYLTPFSFAHQLFVAILIGMGGFVGDITVSALKRDLGVKDMGTILPGHGGLLDRVDSLTFTAPLVLHFVRYSYI